MGRLFLIVAILSLIAFITGLIKPSRVIFWSKNKTKIQAIVYLIIFVVFGIIGLLFHFSVI
jgi:hypothetical protein